MMESRAIVKEPQHNGYLYMNGTEVMNFTLVEVVENVKAFLAEAGLSKDEIDLYAFHQANRLIVSSLASSLGITEDKAPFMANNTGNTSSASIPLLLNTLKNQNLSRAMLIGFGAGLATGICLVDMQKTRFLGIKEI